jgi:hypothetical protein
VISGPIAHSWRIGPRRSNSEPVGVPDAFGQVAVEGLSLV